MNVKTCFALVFGMAMLLSQAQTKDSSALAAIHKFQAELNAEFANREESPLTEEDFATFTGLPFYPIDTAFYVVARFERAVDAQPFEMKTTTDRKPVYALYGTATFTLKGEKFQLHIYQNLKLRESEEYRDYLFLPFTDLTNDNDTYPGGRYIDLRIPKGESIIIDFNKAYNPLCAYNAKYSCPIPPKENFINFAITAGVKYH